MKSRLELSEKDIKSAIAYWLAGTRNIDADEKIIMLNASVKYVGPREEPNGYEITANVTVDI